MWSWRKFAVVAVAVVAAVAAPRLVQAQTGSIGGTVIDAETKQPLDGVTVSVEGTSYGVQTRANGTYLILGVPPGTYTVVARRVGYQTKNISGVAVVIDVKRPLDIELTSSTTLGAVTVTATPVPLVEQGMVGASTTITAETIASLPVTSIAEVLALQQGYEEVPQNTNLISLAEERRNTTQPTRVRGARGGATVTLVDGIPVNNPLTGTQAITLPAISVSQFNFNRGYMAPAYGNGLAGVINQAVRVGGERFQGALNYQTSTLAGALGSTPDKLLGQHFFSGYIQGPVPATNNMLRYSLSGQIQNSANRILKFDDEVSRWDVRPKDTEPDDPFALDLIPGWRAFGGTQNQAIVGKLTFLPTNSTILSFSAIGSTRQALTYDRRYFLAYTGEPWSVVNTLMDSLGLSGQRNYQSLIQGSVRDQSFLYAARFEQRYARSNFSASIGRTGLKRLTCNVWQGVCTTDHYWRGNFNASFIAPFTPVGFPYSGTDLFYGGEDYTTLVGRADYVSQLTDHHNVTVGASFSQYDIVYDEVRGGGSNSGIAPTIHQIYRAKPLELASYLQDNIEYDFLSLTVGVRYDYGIAKGKGFSNPLNATNGTTAREVCNGTAAGINTTPFTYGGNSGVIACLLSPPNENGKPFLLDSATKLAQVDDFKEAKARTAFSPRLGVSFPLTEQSSFYFNAGRYTKNPQYHDLYRNSGVGTVAGPADGFCAANAVKPGTTECHPPLTFNNPEFIGNPNLLLEQATSYSVGYNANIGRNYAITAEVFNLDQSGLTGVRTNDAIQDIGSTYNGVSLPKYTIAVNQDFATTRGIEVQFLRSAGRGSVWGYNINYGWQRSTENSPPPDRSVEAQLAGEITQGSTLRELISSGDVGHTFNISGNLQWRTNDVPRIPGGRLLRNTRVGLTHQWRSGRVYTPNRNFAISGIVNTITVSDQNTGRGPSTQNTNLSINKDFSFGNAQYGFRIQVNNLFDRNNCLQVFANTGNCNTGLREFSQRRVGNSQGTSSTNADQPEFRSQRRSIQAGVTITF
jgi:hypothetical protein